jgi:hypothetical protein
MSAVDDDRYTIKGGMLCQICGLRYYRMSCGGPGICPSCDCGNFGQPHVQRQGARIRELEAAAKAMFEADNFADACQECGIGGSAEWLALKALCYQSETACKHERVEGGADYNSWCIDCGGMLPASTLNRGGKP